MRALSEDLSLCTEGQAPSREKLAELLKPEGLIAVCTCGAGSGYKPSPHTHEAHHPQ